MVVQDLHLIRSSADENAICTPLIDAAVRLYESAGSRGLGAADLAAVVSVLARKLE